MPASSTRTFTNQGLVPTMYPEKALTDAVRMAPGSYAAGTVMGRVPGTTAVNDVQTITITGTPTGGSVRYNFNGQVTAAIAWNAAAAAVQTAFEALSNIGAGNVAVTGGPGPGTPWVLTFQGTAAGLWQPLITLYSNSLTGGTTPTSTIAHTTPGVAAGGYWTAYNDGASDGSEVARALCQYQTTVNEQGRHTVGGGEFGEFSMNAPVYICGYFRTADLTGLDANGVADLGRLITGTTSTLSSTGTIISLI